MSYLNHALTGKRVLVTGATGFIGGRLAQRLALEEEAVVTGTGRQLDKVPFLTEVGVNLIPADLQDTAVMRQLMAGQEIVFHCAALRAKHQAKDTVAEQINSTAIEALMWLADETGVRRFIHVSSMNAYGPPQRPVVDETHPLNTNQRDTYGRTKALGEVVARKAADGLDLELVIVRPGMVYGPRSDGWSIRMVEVLRKGLPVIYGGGQGNTYQVYIDNLIDGMLLTAVRPQAAGEAFNFVDPPVTWQTFFNYYAAMCSEKPRAIPMWAARILAWANEMANLGLPLTRERLEYYIQSPTFPLTKAENLLGYRPRVDIDEGMRLTEIWLRESGYLTG
ncbi:MAG: NAD(P)-dependent oxidoreductase [Ardenticatenaceae bacterium]|nr:NAD(P)-dependent oxidoreductase [Ardenticatenaceae bacterium]